MTGESTISRDLASQTLHDPASHITLSVIVDDRIRSKVHKVFVDSMSHTSPARISCIPSCGQRHHHCQPLHICSISSSTKPQLPYLQGCNNSLAAFKPHFPSRQIAPEPTTLVKAHQSPELSKESLPNFNNAEKHVERW